MQIGQYFKPMLVSDVHFPRRLFSWLPDEVSIQPKLDGIRIQVHKLGKQVWLYTRGGLCVNDKFPEIVQSVQRFPQDFIIDGEAICFDEQKISFNLVMKKLKSGQGIAKFFAFDILNLNNYDLADQTYYGRRESLEKLKLRIVPQTITVEPDELKAIYIDTLKKGFEGIVIRDINSQYEFNNRGFAMRKLKPLRTLDVKIIGVEKKNKGFKSYTVAVKEGAVAKISTIKNISIGAIIEMKHDGFIASEKYPLGKTLRFPKFLRTRHDLKKPCSLENEVKIPA